MIIVRSPLRISLGGGGTDLPSYYNDHEGFLLSAAINKYVYLMILKPFLPGITLKYTKKETVNTIGDIVHPLFRETLKHFSPDERQIEIVSQADIPSGTGLGSSGSFTTGLIKGLATHYRKFLSQIEVAELACFIEIEKLGEPVGKQDQYAAAIGGINSFRFTKNAPVEIKPLDIKPSITLELEDRLLLFFTGFSRNAGSVLQDQVTKTKALDEAMIDNLHFTKQLGVESEKCLLAGDLIGFSQLMNEHWQYKKKRSQGMTNLKINEWYELGMRNGALAGKLVGAGGGGFLMFVAENKHLLRRKMKEAGLIEGPFSFDYTGTAVIAH